MRPIPINLVNWYFGAPMGVGGTVLNRIFSRETDDEVFGTLYFADGKSAQVSVNWSDESCRKMSTKITIWGTGGPDLRRPPGVPGLPARHGARSRRATRRAGTSATPPI